MVAFTLLNLSDTVQRVAKETPGRIYQSPDPRWCMYWHPTENAPGCIFGHALLRLGLDPSELPNKRISVLLAEWFGGDADDMRYYPFQRVQNLQDGAYGGTRQAWKACVLPLAGK